MKLRTRKEDWESMQRRMLRETEVYLEESLRHPDSIVRIPRHPVGRGHFSRDFAEAFWERVLGA
jgi:hypothetical protein